LRVQHSRHTPKEATLLVAGGRQSCGQFEPIGQRSPNLRRFDRYTVGQREDKLFKRIDPSLIEKSISIAVHVSSFSRPTPTVYIPPAWQRVDQSRDGTLQLRFMPFTLLAYLCILYLAL
jgi:hypothetical protein